MIDKLIDVCSYVLVILPLLLVLVFLKISSHGRQSGCFRKAVCTYLVLGCISPLVFFRIGVITPVGTQMGLRLAVQTMDVLGISLLWPFVALMFP